MSIPVSKYRPSNGTEGIAFIENWCGNCARSGGPGKPDDTGSELMGCSITGRTMAFDIEEPEYPTEWQRTDDGPTCTAFVHIGDAVPPPRCPNTLDMFAAPAEGGAP